MKICNKMFAECLGTFVLVLGGCGTALFGHVGFLGVAIAFGLTVIAMAYGVGHISGAHLNLAAQERKSIIGLSIPQVVAVLDVGRVDRLVAVSGSEGEGAHVVRCAVRIAHREQPQCHCRTDL